MLAAALAAAFSVFMLVVLHPGQARAFWPFSQNADAAGPSLIPDANTPVLSAATNINPVNSAPALLAISDDSALVASAGPEGTPPSGNAAQSGQISLYTVRAGDTLSEIATLYGVSVNTIIWANDLGSNKAIHAGETLVILPVTGVEHVVAKGETLASLAKKYGGDAGEIASYNGLDASAALAVGSTIIIPNGELGATVNTTPVKTGTRPASGSQSNPYRGGSGPKLAGYYANPVPGAVLTQGLHGENAVDLAIARGTPVHAAADGTVIVARNNGAWNGGYGNYVVIAHGNGTQTLYAHESSVIVSVGQQVVQGQVIGYVGKTGDATGAHVHFEVRGAANPFASCPLGAVCAPQ